jgi:nitroreductase
MNFNSAMRWRYATKKFDPTRSVAKADVEMILEAGNLTASSYGLQPYQFVLLTNRELREQLVASSYGQRQVVDSSHLIVIAIRTDIDERYIRNFTKFKEIQRGLAVGSLDDYAGMMIKSILGMDGEARLQWAARQAYIAMGTMLAACAIAGVDSCPMEGFVSQDYDERLKLGDRHLHAQLLLPIGYRSSDDVTQDQTKVRRSMQDMVLYL